MAPPENNDRTFLVSDLEYVLTFAKSQKVKAIKIWLAPHEMVGLTPKQLFVEIGDDTVRLNSGVKEWPEPTVTLKVIRSK